MGLQPTLYSQVWGLFEGFIGSLRRIPKKRVNFALEYPSIIADMTAVGIDNPEGINFSLPRKNERASLLKQRITNRKYYYQLTKLGTTNRGNI